LPQLPNEGKPQFDSVFEARKKLESDHFIIDGRLIGPALDVRSPSGEKVTVKNHQEILDYANAIYAQDSQ
jgi:hypothetical protein